MKSLAVIVNEFETTSEVFIYQLFDSLKDDFRITYYCYRKNNKKASGNFSPRVVEIPKAFSLPFFTYLAREVFKLRWPNSVSETYYSFILERIEDDIIYFPFIAMTRRYERILTSNKLKKKIFSSVRGTDYTITPYLNPSVIPTYQQIAPRLAGLHFLSDELFQLSGKYGIRPKKHRVIYQGVNLTSHPYNQYPVRDKLRIITIGRLHYVKGFEYAILMAKELRDLKIDFELHIIGDGPEREKLFYQIHTLKLAEYVKLTGALNKTQIAEYLSSANVYVHTHLVNGLSNTMLEALACNLKVVIFDSNLKSYNLESLCKMITEVPKFDYVALAVVLANIAQTKSYGNPYQELVECLAHFKLERHTAEFRHFFNEA